MEEVFEGLKPNEQNDKIVLDTSPKFESPSNNLNKLNLNASIISGTFSPTFASIYCKSPSKISRGNPLARKMIEQTGTSEEDLKIFKEAFDILDYERIGIIYPKEVNNVIKSLNLNETNPGLYEILVKAFTSYPEGFNFQQFVTCFTSDLINNNAKDHLHRLFKLYDTDNSEKMNVDSLKQIVKEIGQSVTTNELSDILNKLSGKGPELDFEKFFSIMTKKAVIQ